VLTSKYFVSHFKNSNKGPWRLVRSTAIEYNLVESGQYDFRQSLATKNAFFCNISPLWPWRLEFVLELRNIGAGAKVLHYHILIVGIEVIVKRLLGNGKREQHVVPLISRIASVDNGLNLKKIVVFIQELFKKCLVPTMVSSVVS